MQNFTQQQQQQCTSDGVVLLYTTSLRWFCSFFVQRLSTLASKNADCIVFRVYTATSFYIMRLQMCWFLPRDAMRMRGLCCRPLSVCPSDTLVYLYPDGWRHR